MIYLRYTYLFFYFTIIFAISNCSILNREEECDPDSPNCRVIEIDISEPIWFGAPAWHPNGEWIAVGHSVFYNSDTNIFYSSESNSFPDTTIRNYGLYLLNAATGVLQDEPLLEWGKSFRWSPDGKQLVVEWNRQIYSVGVLSLDPPRIDTASIKQLTAEGRNYNPSWSPDGRGIAYFNVSCGSNAEPLTNDSCGVIIMNSNGSFKKRIAYGYDPMWSKKDNLIYYTGYTREIFATDSSGTRLLKLTTAENSHTSPQPSPNGSTIIFQSIPPYPAQSITSIWSTNPDGSNQYKISPDWSEGFSWRPDGKEIIFVKYNPNKAEEGNGQLWLMNPDGTNIRQFTHFDPQTLLNQ